MKKHQAGARPLYTEPIVADQPGLSVSVVGICTAFFLSFLFLSFFSNVRIAKKLDVAINQIHPQLKINFKDAQVSLRSGLIPRFSILVENVDLNYFNDCYLNPHLVVDHVELPLSILSFFKGGNPIRSVKLGSAQMHLATEKGLCQQAELKNPSDKPETAKDNSRENPMIQIENEISQTDLSQQVQSVSIEKLTLFSAAFTEQLLEVEDLDFDLVSANPKHIHLNSKVHLFKEDHIKDYFSHGELEADFREYPAPLLNLQIVGHVREGSYRSQLAVDFHKNSFQMISEFEHVPFTPFVDLLQRFHLLKLDLPVKKIWTSFKAEASGEFHQLNNAKLKIQSFSIEGELGSVKTDHVIVKNFLTPVFSPFRVNLQKILMDEVFDQVSEKSNYPFLNHWGSFDGQIEYLGENEWKVNGLHSDLEFIFSNLGQRQHQKIDNILVDAKYKNQIWKVHIPRADLKDGVFDGEFDFTFDQQNDRAEVVVDIDEIQFSPEVQNIMSMGGNFGIANMNYRAQFHQKKLISEQGVFGIKFLNLYGLQIEKLKGKISYVEPKHELHLQSHKLLVEHESVIAKVIEPLLVTKLNTTSAETQHFEKHYAFNNLAGTFNIQSLQNVSWKNVSAMNNLGRYSIDGAWNEAGDLSGKITRKMGQKEQKWNIIGTRGDPQFAP